MNRPAELSAKQTETAKMNDERIIEALNRLKQLAGPGKSLPTGEDVAKMAGVSLNTVRNRNWALVRLKSIKDTYKVARTAGGVLEGHVGQHAEPTQEQLNEPLREQVEALLRQNALLYEEVLYLKELVAKRDRESDRLRSSAALASNVRPIR